MPHPYAQDLPASPDPEQQKKRAKDLLKALRAGEAEAIARFRYGHPRLAHRPDAELVAMAKLSDAQWVIAREYGFASWPKLQAHLAGGLPEIARPFEVELQYYRDRAAGIRSNHRTGEAGSLRLVQRFHPRFAAASEAEIRGVELSQQDAELVVARSHGFDDWAGFAGRIEAMRAGRAEEPFRTAFEAIRGDDRTALAAVLAAHPGLVNARGTNGNRLLMLAISMNRLALAGDLLDAGADRALTNDKGWGPLHDIAGAGGRGDREARLALLDRLVAAGGPVEAEAYGDGGTPLAVALFWGHGTIAERLAAEVVVPLNLRIAAGLGRMDLIALFFDAGGRLRPEAGHHRGFYRPHSGFPEWHMTDSPQEILDEALTWAARSGRIEAMATLLACGADIDGAPHNGAALHWALLSHRAEAVDWLIGQGADVSRGVAWGDTADVTPLHMVAGWANDPRVARLLLDHGADPSIRDRTYASTPLGWAEHFGHPEVAAVLKGDSEGEAGA
ncbi:ankyrin repeat domain-containing protein [Mycobacterium sp. KBS0706]|uniref:ankyrin repeat domain-containing protein n=1 Tax=Mycobacterium sp. KBS0706 TaxID=2578109 RepID=UPI00110F7C5B|nr:ankyrin repeat domain-containing protein [Mycobacterium sp. KBS0706]TSD89520.1 ankyrin repeat domain-containing protein [Mycobacterium sp. KBS0706]